jgi:hypothetical protein
MIRNINDDVKFDSSFGRSDNHNQNPRANEPRNSDLKLDKSDNPVRIPNFKSGKLQGKNLKIVLLALAILIVGGLVVWGGYSYFEIQRLRDPAELQRQTELQAEAETQALAEKISKLMQLPEGDPVVATVTDKDKLADQPFFVSAENGDKVLIFSESSVAVIYRESDNKIINYGPIAITSDEATATEAISQPTQ